jgi:hypothetical protein
VTTIAVTIYFVAVISWSMPSPSPLKTRIDSTSQFVFTFFGLWQRWNMFAPLPRDQDRYISARFNYGNGSFRVLELSNMSKMSFAERWQKERWRKYFNDKIFSADSSAEWPLLARWLARNDQELGAKPVSIEFFRHWRPTLPLASPASRPELSKTTWQFEKFYSYSIVSEEAK